jgi:S-phase kinase-associated protein 1
MEIEGLKNLCAAKIASLIRGKNVDEVRETFSIENDFTPEEEAEYKAQYAWAFPK